jgi:hypothetical protein
MIKNKPYQIFLLLSKEEKREILKMLASPFFNKEKLLLSLFAYFIDEVCPSKEDWFLKEFPSKVFNDLVVRRYLSSLNKLLEQYLTWKELETKEDSKKELLLAALRKRMLNQHYQSRFSKTVKSDKSSLDFTSHLFLHQYQLSCDKEKFNKQLNQRQPKENTDEGILQLDLFYVIEKLRHICELHNSRTIFELEERSYLNDEVLELAKEAPFNTYPQVRIYTLLLETITDPDNETAFYELQLSIEKNASLLSPYEEREIYLALINYCIRKINKGNKKSLEECFLLYQKMEKNSLLISGKYISPWTFKNVITAALRLNELEWTVIFIKNYKNKLVEEYRENAFNYNMAKYNFHLKKYHKVLPLLQKVEHDDIFYGLDTRALLMKVYYIQGEEEALFSLTDSFRIYLRRKKKIPAERRKTYLNFIKFVRRLITIHPRDYKKIKALELKIKNTDKVADKAWMLEVINLRS